MNKHSEYMKSGYILIAILTLLISCSVEKVTGQKYLRWVGDIEHDPEIDMTDFILCNGDENVRQYFNMYEGMQIEGEKIKIETLFNEKYQPVNINESGWIRVRFIVNCEGHAGRYRIIQSDENYQERPFDKRISGQLLELTKSLDRWKVLSVDSQPVDYYQYLIFKMKNGEIEKIMP